jgi:hypothetical protein
MEKTTTDQQIGNNDSEKIRRTIDATVAELGRENYDHRELAAALLEARDTLLIQGRIPDWFGQEEATAYR